jgi:DMSO/TMAO reductase YedYZ molybdopterin-dependent catalytic subunit
LEEELGIEACAVARPAQLSDAMKNRREFLKSVAVLGGGIALPASGKAAETVTAASQLPDGTIASALLASLPGKRPLIKRSFRPPNYETPLAYFSEMFTPNDVFFVRYHLPDIPEVKLDSWKLTLGGEGAEKPFEVSLGELKNGFEQVEIAALCFCSGNRRGLFQPHVAGIEWGYGAMGNARWKGVRLKDVLAKAGLKKETLEIAFDGADGPALENSADFRKSLPVWKAMDENTLLAYEMNGAPLPHWNGFPLRLVVPGWTGTYWMKHLTSVSLITKPLENFWMKPGYRIPKGKFPLVDRFVSQETESNTPITEMVVSSLMTNLEEGQRFSAGQDIEVRGIAWDGGYGIEQVEVSVDSGASWRAAQSGRDHGRFSWRQFAYRFASVQPGRYALLARASNRVGATQTYALIANPAGYHHNLVQKINIEVV